MSQTSTDPISDMLTRIRNAILVNKNEITVPHSKIKESIAKLLKDNRFLSDVSVVNLPSIGKLIKIVINDSNLNSNITEIKRLSKPCKRLYVPVNEIPSIKRGRGLIIVSTSKGLMTGDKAKTLNIGGELICQIY